MFVWEFAALLLLLLRVAVGAQTVEKTVRSIVGARAGLEQAAAATAVMVVMVTVHTAEPLERVPLEGRKSLLSRWQITRLKCLSQLGEG